MAVKARGRSEDSVYFDQANGYWSGSVSLGFTPDGKRRRRKVRGHPRQRSATSSGNCARTSPQMSQTPATYSVRQAIDDWLNDGLDGRSAATVTKYRHVLKPVVELTGHAALRDLTAHDVRHALTVLGKDRSSATVAIAHNALTRAIRHAGARDLVRRNVSALIGSPEGQAGRPSQALTLDQAQKLLKTAGNLKKYRLGAYVSLCLLTGLRTEEARALTWEHVDLTASQTGTLRFRPAWPCGGRSGSMATRRPGSPAGPSGCRRRRSTRSARTANCSRRTGSRRAKRGKIMTWCSAREPGRNSMPRTYGASSGTSPTPRASAKGGRRRS